MKHTTTLFISMLVLLTPASGRAADAQTASEPQTREEALRLERENKAETLTPPESGGVERWLVRLEDGRMFERLLNPAVGFYPKLGSVTAGSGMAFGAGYRYPFTDHAAWNMFGSASFRRYWAIETRLIVNNIAGSPLFVDLHARGSDYPDEDYFGQGSLSLRTDHVSYGLRQTMAGATTGLNLAKWLSTGVRADYFNPRIHEGPDTRVPPIGSVFPPGDVPGLVTQPDFANTEVFVEANTREPRGNPRGGGRYRASYQRFTDLDLDRYPNDIVPHEHRRELRANRVIASWVNHDDSRGINSLDMLDGPAGRQAIRHYVFDFGSTLGSGSTQPQVPRAGNEYIVEWKPAMLTAATLGLWVRPWIKVDYPKVAPSVGRFESAFFDPVLWRPEYPNPAFDNLRTDDAFWAADLVARFSDEAIRAIVAKARYSDASASAYIADTLIARRDKIVRTWLTAVNPIVEPTLSASAALTFRNAAVERGVASAPAGYRLAWSRVDSATGEPIGTARDERVTQPAAAVPRAVVSDAPGALVSLEIRTDHPDFPVWQEPVRAYFRRTAGGWQTVGFERVGRLVGFGAFKDAGNPASAKRP